jgi:hypothetical protein
MQATPGDKVSLGRVPNLSLDFNWLFVKPHRATGRQRTREDVAMALAGCVIRSATQLIF